MTTPKLVSREDAATALGGISVRTGNQCGGLLDWNAGDPEAIDVYVCKEDAQRALEACLHDEPGWRGLLRVQEIELSDGNLSPNERNELRHAREGHDVAPSKKMPGWFLTRDATEGARLSLVCPPKRERKGEVLHRVTEPREAVQDFRRVSNCGSTGNHVLGSHCGPWGDD
jgi:hypothetical protein